MMLGWVLANDEGTSERTMDGPVVGNCLGKTLGIELGLTDGTAERTIDDKNRHSEPKQIVPGVRWMAQRKGR